MNCFEWNNHSSDFLDGTLPESIKREAEEHVESCKDCGDRFKHYRQIISSIAARPRANLPAPLKRAPLSAALPRIESNRMSLSRWQQVPWYLRTLLEATGIVILVLVGISSTPKIRTIYERNIEKTLNEFKDSLTTKESLTDSEQIDATIPPLQGSLSRLSSDGDDLSGEDDSEDHNKIHVGRSQLWRFTLKTVSPDELRPQVVKALTELNIPANTPGLGGIQVPGGIEFDLVLPQTLVPQIKHSLQKLAPKSPEKPGGSVGPDNFSWYRVKSKRKIPDGKSQVVIWLAQPH